MVDESSAGLPHTYRIYLLDADGRFIGAEIIDAADDVDALAQARSKIESFPIEVWDRDRMLARLEPPRG